MKHQITSFLTAGLFLLSISSLAQSVGIGTEEPNSNAILELVAPNNDQGLLVPRMTTSERNANSFTSNLSASENGLMVYDEDQNKFFFWINDQWVELATGNLSGLPDQASQSGKYLTTNGTTALWENIDFNTLSNVPADLSDGDDNTQLTDTDISNLGYIKSANDSDADASNELQDLSITGNSLSLTNSSVSVDLSPFSGTNTDNQTLGLSGTDLSITGGNTIDVSSINTTLSEAEVDAFANNNGYLTSEADGSTTNEVNTGMSLSGTTIQITDANSTQGINIGGTFATDAELAVSDAADGDKDDSNEIQNISTTGAAGNISLSGGSTLNLNVNDGDASSSNEFQDLTLSGSTLSMTNSSVNIDLSPFSGTNTDNQTLSLSGDNLSITGGNTLDISGVDTNLTEAEVDGFVSNNGFLTAADISGFDTDASDDFDGAFGSLSGIPTGLGDGDDDTQLSEAQVDGFVSDNGFLTATDISGYDTNASDDFDGAFGSLSGIPTGLDDGDDDTQLSEAQVDGFVSDNGYLTAVDISGFDTDASDDFDGVFGSLSGIPTGLDDGDDDTQLSEAQVDGFVSDNGFLTATDITGYDTDASDDFDGVFGSLSGIPAGLSDGDDVNDADASTTNELNTSMTISGTSIRVTDAGGTRSVNIGGTFATDAELAASAAADGDKSASNEYNTGMSLSGTSIRVTDGGGTRSVNIGGTFATDSELDGRTFEPSAFKATLSKNGTIPVGSSNLLFDSEVYDIDGSYDAPSGVYSVPENGLYNFGGLLIFSNIPTGLVTITITDGSTLYVKSFAPNSIQSSIGFSADLLLNAGDKIEVSISNTNFGGSEAQAINTIASPDQSNFFLCAKRFN
ncbi:beta strand repeat-containing protein [Ekhidna sp.]